MHLQNHQQDPALPISACRFSGPHRATLISPTSVGLASSWLGGSGAQLERATSSLRALLCKDTFTSAVLTLLNCSFHTSPLSYFKDVPSLFSDAAASRRHFRQVLSVIAQQLLQLFSAKRELTSYNVPWEKAVGGASSHGSPHLLWTKTQEHETQVPDQVDGAVFFSSFQIAQESDSSSLFDSSREFD